ncbi:rrna processing protein, partial [Moniliophthora roreri]
MSAHS